MKQHKLTVLLLACILLLGVLPSCGQKPQAYKAYSLDYFDTATTVTGYAESQEDFDTVSGEILAELGEYHRLYTIYHRFEGLENLCTVNELVDGRHRTVTVDRRIIDLLLYAKEMYTVTGGKLNIAMGSVLSIWHDYRELTITDPAMRLDVGAIAKGYAVEMVARSLEERGITGYVINVGGNVRTVGVKGDGSPWIAGIENPDTDAEEPYVAYLKLSGESVVTSGSYQRYYLVNGERFHHIIDSETLMPAEDFRSVSVVCKHSGRGDALSTALFCMPLEEGLALVERLPDAEAFWVLPDGSTRQSEGFSAYITQP